MDSNKVKTLGIFQKIAATTTTTSSPFCILFHWFRVGFLEVNTGSSDSPGWMLWKLARCLWKRLEKILADDSAAMTSFPEATTWTTEVGQKNWPMWICFGGFYPLISMLYLGVLKPKGFKNSVFHMSCTPHRPWLLISSVAAYLDLTGCQGQGIPRSTNPASWFTEFIWKETTLQDREGNTFFRNGPIKRRDWKKQFDTFWLIRTYIMFYQYVLSHWLIVSKKWVNRSVLNSWKNKPVDRESGSYFIHLLFLWSFIHFYFHQKIARWFSFRTTVMFYESFTQLPCIFLCQGTHL